MQKDFVLATLTATYQHPSLGLRYLYANLQELQSRAIIREYTIKQGALAIVEDLLAHAPKVIGFGIYIWNRHQTLQVLEILRKVSPKTQIVLGGPEVSHETEGQDLLKYADYVICGEADQAFYELLKTLDHRVDAGNVEPAKILRPLLPNVEKIQLPYNLYSDHDIQTRHIYVEASRGCPFKCEYCLSSLDTKVRNFPIDEFLHELDQLILRGARSFKFIDRTFNLSMVTCSKILGFFLEKVSLGLFLHFEMVPDRLPVEIKELIAKFPAGALQFEVGIQTLNPVVAKNISRRTDLPKAKENFEFLRSQPGVHIHADLIVGLPGETLESFARGFDELHSWGPQEIQVGILKRLKGTPIIRHDQDFGMTYSEVQPFQILQTKDLSFSDVVFMTKFAKYWDLFANSGRFPGFVSEMETQAVQSASKSLFEVWEKFANFLNLRFAEAHSISLENQALAARDFLISLSGEDGEERASEILRRDYQVSQPSKTPRFLKIKTSSDAEPDLSTYSGTARQKRRQSFILRDPLPI